MRAIIFCVLLISSVRWAPPARNLHLRTHASLTDVASGWTEVRSDSTLVVQAVESLSASLPFRGPVSRSTMDRSF